MVGMEDRAIGKTPSQEPTRNPEMTQSKVKPLPIFADRARRH
jgi:hypothetical protein